MEKKYAFYATKENSIKDLLITGNIENMHIAEIVQKEGEDVSRHGSPMYDIETMLTDVETGKQFHHSHYDAYKLNRVDYLAFNDVKGYIEELTNQAENRIKELQNEIQKLEKQKENCKLTEKSLFKKMGKFQHIERSDVKEQTLEKTNALYARFNAKQIKQHFEHPSKVDSDGKPLKMVNIMIPSKEFRYFRFGADSHGFERDDIPAYWTSIKGLVKKDQDKDGNQKKNGKRYIYLNKNIEDPVYKIRFESQKNDGGLYVEPDPVYLNAKQLSKIYNEQYIIGKERRKERDPNRMLEENNDKDKQKKKENIEMER